MFTVSNNMIYAKNRRVRQDSLYESNKVERSLVSSNFELQYGHLTFFSHLHSFFPFPHSIHIKSFPRGSLRNLCGLVTCSVDMCDLHDIEI